VLTSNLLPSAAQSSPKGDLAVITPGDTSNEQGSPPSYHSVVKSTSVDMFKFNLATLGKVSKNISVPGLILAMNELLSVIERVQVC
jgi:hypothetical protein